MQKCRICGSTDFYKEAGYFFCQTCQMQNEDIREEVLELRVDSTTRLRKTRIRKLRLDKSGAELGWTSWELYNFVLIGLTNELIELGVSPTIKLTVLQLWATYLGKIEVAFISIKKRCLPKLARRYKRRDAEIIYGKVQLQKKCRKRKRTGSSTNTSVISGDQSEGSSSMRQINKNKKLLATEDYNRYLQSQDSSADGRSSLFNQSMHSIQSSSVASSENEGKVQFGFYAKEEARKIKRLSKNLPKSERMKYRAKHTSTQYKMGPYVITPMRLWAIIYLALRIHNHPIQLGDMLRYGREGHLSYYKLDHLVPPEISLTANERNFLTQNVEVTHKGLRRIAASMAKFLGVWDIICPDLLSLVNRYCQELGLPRGIQLYTERLIALSLPNMSFDIKKPYIPNYEGRAIAFIIIVLKILLALDGITEYHISRIAEKINSVAIERGLLNEKLFNFQEWQRYIECRKTILVHAHYPTKMKYSPNSEGIDDLYVKFVEFLSSKSDRKESDVKNSTYHLSEELISAMSKHITDITTNDLSPKTIVMFPPSLTPLYSYLQHLFDHPYYDIPSVLRNDFYLTKVGYMTKSDSLIELAMNCDIELEIIDSNVHFLEKNVPVFEQSDMPSMDELKQLVDVQDDLADQEESESVNDYLHAKIPCIIKFNAVKNQYYNSIVSRSKSLENIDMKNDFTFTETLPNGKLAIPSDSDDENEEEDSEFIDNSNQEKILLGNRFCDKYNLRLSLAEKRSIYTSNIIKNIRFKKLKIQLERNTKGQFVKKSALRTKIEKNSEDVFTAEESVSFYDSPERKKVCIDGENISKEQLRLSENIDLDGIDLDDIYMINNSLNISNCFSLSDISFFNEINDVSAPAESKKNNGDSKKYQFFRPFNEYWTYHCIFSRTKSKNFLTFEKALPRTFRWLLNECALTVEMTREDLYEEICLIENYLSKVLKCCGPENNVRGNVDTTNKSELNFILSKW